MLNAELERQFTSMLAYTDTARAYGKLCNNYLTVDKDYVMLPLTKRKEKLKALREGEPKEWITKVFTEGLDIPPLLYKVNILWLKHLEEIS